MSATLSIQLMLKLAIKGTVANMLDKSSGIVNQSVQDTLCRSVELHKNLCFYILTKSYVDKEKKVFSNIRNFSNTFTLDNTNHCRACTAVASVNIHSQLAAAN